MTQKEFSELTGKLAEVLATTNDQALKAEIAQIQKEIASNSGLEFECDPDEYPCDTGCCKLSARIKAALQQAGLSTI
jgi:hypothetical protein